MTFDPAVRGPPIPEAAEAPTTVNISELLLGGGEMVMGWGGEGEGDKEEEEEGGVREVGDVTDKIPPQQATKVSVVLCMFINSMQQNYMHITHSFSFLTE